MQRSFLGRLQKTAWFNLGGAVLLLVLIPALLLLVLAPLGYNTAQASPQASLVWIQAHTALFLLYRLALISGFALLLGLPFALFRIIIAQEIIGRAEIEAQENTDAESEQESADQEEQGADKADEKQEKNVLPDFAWRGKGFAVIAAWTGLPGLLIVTGGILASTIHLWSSAGVIGPQAQLPDNFTNITSLFSIFTYTIGGGLLAISCIFFGLVIARSGSKLWPPTWVAFGYLALLTGAITSGSAVQNALAPASGQANLIPFMVLFIALWSLCFGVMVIRLKAE